MSVPLSSQGRGLGGVGPQGIGDGCACLGRARCNALGRSALGDDRGDRRLQGVGLGRARVDAEEHLGGRKHRFGRGRCGRMARAQVGGWRQMKCANQENCFCCLQVYGAQRRRWNGRRQTCDASRRSVGAGHDGNSRCIFKRTMSTQPILNPKDAQSNLRKGK